MTEKPPASNNIIKQAIAFLLAGALLYFAFRGCDFAKIWHYAQATNPFYIALICISCIISHVLRAWRWIYLLEPIENRRVSLWNSFCAVILGYAVNVPLPRGGEVVRLLSISKSEKLPWAGVLPTMFIDRMLDVVLLGLLLGITLTSLPEKLISSLPLIVPGGMALTACSIVGLAALPWSGKLIRLFISNEMIKKRLPEKVSAKLEELAAQFEVGTKSLMNKRSLPYIAVLTPTIWFFYWLNFYMGIWAFGLNDKVNPMQCLVVFTIGSMGVLVPAPGSVGTFHFFVSKALSLTAGIDPDLALAYVSVVHLFCFIVVPCITAALCVGIQTIKTASPTR